MTALPKRRISTHRQGKRRAAQKLIPPALIKCPHCEKLVIPHRVCPRCGFYKGKEIIHPKISKERKHNEKEV